MDKDGPPNFDISITGIAGQSEHLITVNQFKDPNDPRNNGGPAGLPGKYKVIFTFSRPGFPLVTEYELFFVEHLAGDSHLAIAKPAFTPPGNENADQVKFDAETEGGKFEFTGFPNSRGFLSKINSEFEANNFEDAEQIAYRALAPSLSNISTHLDIPLHIYQTDSIELKTGNSRMSYSVPFREAPFAIPSAANMSGDFRFYASLYREALVSNSPAYQFLCFYKIIDGTRQRRDRLHAERKKQGKEIAKPVAEVIPADEAEFVRWLNAIFPVRPPQWDPIIRESIFRTEVRGRSFGYVIEKELQPLWVQVAHALTKDGELTILADEALHRQRLNKWLPLTRCIARRLLKNEFPSEFLSYLSEDGTIKTK